MTTITISSGTTVSNTTVNSGDELTGISSTANGGGTEDVYGGGVGSVTTISNRATENNFRRRYEWHRGLEQSRTQ